MPSTGLAQCRAVLGKQRWSRTGQAGGRLDDRGDTGKRRPCTRRLHRSSRSGSAQPVRLGNDTRGGNVPNETAARSHPAASSEKPPCWSWTHSCPAGGPSGWDPVPSAPGRTRAETPAGLRGRAWKGCRGLHGASPGPEAALCRGSAWGASQGLPRLLGKPHLGEKSPSLCSAGYRGEPRGCHPLRADRPERLRNDGELIGWEMHLVGALG